MAVLPHSVNVGSVVAHIYAHTALSSASKTAVLFILHGYPASARHMKPIADGMFDLAVKKTNNTPEYPKRNLVIVTFVSHYDVFNESDCDAEDVFPLGSWGGAQRRVERT